ncbi:hypothetical protein ACIQOW_18795 [Kitasatospora sp. NPDC091335]|uniref:hypothetical protein n=1 Tax=Kitasatospora sp. NPDC091335 TaxID=3364085 RepID=UPI00382092A7
MTTFEILNGAGADGDQLAGSLNDALCTAAPMVERISGMPLPSHVTVRLLDVAASQALSVVHLGLVYGMAAERLDTEEAFDLAGKLAATAGSRFRMFERITWPLQLGKILYGPTGPELVVVPAAHRAARTSTRQQTVVMGHELTHLAQLELWPDMLTAGPRLRIKAKLTGQPTKSLPVIAPLFEGHAQFVHRDLAAELCGVRARRRLPGEAAPTLRYRATDWLGAVPPLSMVRAIYDRGEKFVSAVMDAGGRSLVHGLFTDEGSLPLLPELLKPELWLARHHPVPAHNAHDQ